MYKGIEPDEGWSLSSIAAHSFGIAALLVAAFAVYYLYATSNQIIQAMEEQKNSSYTTTVRFKDGVEAVVRGRSARKAKCADLDTEAWIYQSVKIITAEISSKDAFKDATFAQIAEGVNDQLTGRCGLSYKVESIEFPNKGK